MKQIVHFLMLVAVLSLSCNFATGLFTEPGLVEATGPILDMTVAASLDEQGRPVGAAFTYPADQPEMVVVVRLGEVAPGALTFNWYRVGESGDEALFEQTVAVEARDTAFSTGLNPGVLAAGTYKVVATFAGGSETIAWDVAELQTSDPAAPPGASGSAAGDAPAPGPSGTRPLYVITPIPGDPGEAMLIAVEINDAHRADRVKFKVSSAWKNGQGNPIVAPVSSFIQVRVGITGSAPDESREFMHNAGVDKIQKNYFQDPCKLPNGSDLPGTSITVTTVKGGSSSQEGLQSATAVLGADTSLPVVQLVSQPSNGAKLKPGDKIKLTAIAEEPKSGGSWQTGVGKIEIFMMEPVGRELLEKEYASYQDKSCGEKSWKQTTQEITYEVPADVKGDFRICAFGSDFAGNIGKKCYTYHTGDPLKGTLNHGLRGEGPSAAGRYTLMWQQDVDLSLSLAPDGTLSGTAQIDYVLDNVHFQSEECGTVHEWIGPLELTLGVTGTWTKDVIDFYYTSDAPLTVTKNFEAIPDCGGSGAEKIDLAYLVGERFHAAWDGQAYTADETNDCSADGPCTTTLKIHLAPPAPGVGFRPGAWRVASKAQAVVDLAQP